MDSLEVEKPAPLIRIPQFTSHLQLLINSDPERPDLQRKSWGSMELNQVTDTKYQYLVDLEVNLKIASTIIIDFHSVFPLKAFKI